MATLSKSIASISANQHLRPFDVRKDLSPVADLVELCFSETLDADGRRYLQRMRAAAESKAYLHWASITAEWTSVPMSGYVWEQDGQLVGNASLIPYYVRNRRFYLIANVAVHPDYRRQGIARNLTLQAITHARQRNAPSIWLHVREDNPGAVGLYRSLGFDERARRTTWHARLDHRSVDFPAGVAIVNPAARHWKIQQAWLIQAYPSELSWHMSFNLSALNPGLWGWIYRLFTSNYVQQWAAVRRGRPLAMVSRQYMSGYTNSLWLAAPQEGEEQVISALLNRARQEIGSHHNLSLDYTARQYSQAIQDAGFYEHQTLIWMEKQLG